MRKQKYCRVCGKKLCIMTQVILMRTFDCRTGKQMEERKRFLSCPDNKELNPFNGGLSHDFELIK